MSIPFLLAQAQNTPQTFEIDSTSLMIFYAFFGIITLITVIAQWIAFEKAGEMGLAAIIPIWGQWVMFKIGGMPGWYALLFFIPILNIIAAIMLIVAQFSIANAYGYGFLMGLLLLFLPPIGWIILASEGEYQN